MTNWEYLVLKVESGGFFFGGVVDVQGISDALNRHGAEGWELVGTAETNMSQGKTRDVLLFLKRPRAGK